MFDEKEALVMSFSSRKSTHRHPLLSRSGPSPRSSAAPKRTRMRTRRPRRRAGRRPDGGSASCDASSGLRAKNILTLRTSARCSTRRRCAGATGLGALCAALAMGQHAGRRCEAGGPSRAPAFAPPVAIAGRPLPSQWRPPATIASASRSLERGRHGGRVVVTRPDGDPAAACST